MIDTLEEEMVCRMCAWCASMGSWGVEEGEGQGGGGGALL
jgi:hypothetical protein